MRFQSSSQLPDSYLQTVQNSVDPGSLNLLVEFGFNRDQAMHALFAANNNVDAAVSLIIEPKRNRYQRLEEFTRNIYLKSNEPDVLMDPKKYLRPIFLGLTDTIQDNEIAAIRQTLSG